MNDTVLPAPPLPEPLLYAALRGSARIIADGAEHRIAAGTALWLPAGVRAEVRPAPGAVVLPVPARPGGPAVPARTPIAPEQVPGLLHEFACALGHLTGEHSAAVSVHGAEASRVSPPPAPRSDELRDLAELLADDPDRGVAEAVRATVSGWSVRTVQRRFSAETGLTLTAWLRQNRIAAAAELLARGRDIEWVAHRVGYRSVAGFIRGFAEYAGTTPGQWRRDATLPAAGDAELRVPASWERRTHRTWSRVNGAHIAVWAAEGEARVTVGPRTIALAPGEAIIIPAGTPNHVQIPPGSLLLPIGYRSGRTGAVGAPLTPAQLGGLESLDTVESMLAAYTRVGTAGVPSGRGFAAALAGSTRAETDPDDAALARLASLISRAPDTPLAHAAAQLGRPEAELRTLVRERTGEPFAVWLRAARMTRARTRLGHGDSPSEVSRAIGYAHLPAFTRAFRAVHGAAPASVGLTDLRPARAAWSHSGLPGTTAQPGAAA